MRIEEALDRYLLQLEADGRSRHTIDQYRRHVLLLAASIGAREIEDIDAQAIARFLASPAARKRRGGGVKKPTTVNALRTSVRTFFGWLHRAGHVGSDPAHLVRRARCGTPPPRGLSPSEQKKLLRTLKRDDGGRDYALFSLLLMTGVRVGSALALEVDDVDLERGELMLRQTKGSRPDTVVLGRRIRDHLRRYIQDRESGPLFPGRNAEPLTPRHVNRRLRMWLERAGIDRRISPHALRHTFALALYARTGDVLIVKEALRHRSIASTLVYARAEKGRLRAALRN